MSELRDYVIVTDCTCDIDIDKRNELGLKIVDNFICVDGKDMPGSIDWGKYYTVKEFYDWVRENRKISSSQTPPQSFITFFGEFLKEGKDILYIGCSTALSATVNSSRIAAEELREEYPNQKIIIIDSLRSSYGLGVQVLKAYDLKKEGRTIEEVAKYTEEHRNYVQQVGTVDSLLYLKRAGRIKGMAAFMGTLVGIKPIIIADAVGMNVSIDKVRGVKASYRHCVQYVKDNIIDSENQYIYISHSDCLDIALQIKAMILEEIKCKGVVFGIVNPSVGQCVGPGMFGIYFYGKKVDFVQK